MNQDLATSPDAASPRRPALSTLTLATIATNVAIVLTGGLVRLSGSGLGCPRWPTCDGVSVLPRAVAEEAPLQQAIEFGNRLFSGVVLAVAIWAWVRIRRERPDLRRVARLVPAGVIAQAVLGGIAVLTGLDPLVVAGHFLISMLIIAAAVVQDQAVRHPDRPAAHGDTTRWARPLATVLLVNGAVTLTLGTLVTAAGPHAGDPGTPRLGLDIRTAALVHADSVWLLVGLTLAGAVVARLLPGTPEPIRRAFAAALAVEVAQGTVGYLQYALGIPAALVGLHLLGACLLTVALVVLWSRTHAAAGVAPAAPVSADSRRDPITVA